MELNERKKKVLLAIIRDYISTAEPVGSRTISKKYELGVSPATIRNEMADLEESGLIEQPHTSAGRIPSDLGYRYYVDYLMQKEELTDAQKKVIWEKIKNTSLEIDSILRCAGQLLSDLTDYAAMITVQSIKEKSVIKHIQLISMTPELVMVVVVLDTGAVYHRIIKVPETVTQEELNHVSFVLNSKLSKLDLEYVKPTLIKDIYMELSRYKFFLDFILDLFQQGMSDSNKASRVYMGGIYNILGQPEFRDVERVRALLELLEKEEILTKILMENQNKELSVRIGVENTEEQMKECSIVAATYYLGDEAIGTIGVLGPTRMEYAKVVAVVEHLASVLNTVLSKLK